MATRVADERSATSVSVGGSSGTADERTEANRDVEQRAQHHSGRVPRDRGGIVCHRDKRAESGRSAPEILEPLR